MVRSGAGGHLWWRGSAGRVLLQAVPDEIEQNVRHAFQVGLFRRDPVQLRVQPIAVAGERRSPGGRVGEDGPEAKHVTGRRDIEPAHLLGCHEAGRSDDHAGAGLQAVGKGVERAYDAEIDDARAVHGDQDVRRLEVSVDQPGVVNGRQGECEPIAEHPHRVLGQGPEVLGHDVVKRRARNILRRDPRHRSLGIGVEDSRRPLPTDPPRRVHLAPEPPAELGVPGVLGVHDLDRDGAPALGPGEIDASHAARTQAGDQAVRPNVRRVFGNERIHARTVDHMVGSERSDERLADAAGS